jgi:hypothetical protein
MKRVEACPYPHFPKPRAGGPFKPFFGLSGAVLKRKLALRLGD